VVLAVRRLHEALRDFALQALFTHQATDALLADRFAILLQVLPQPWATVAIMARRMEGTELGPQHQIALRAGPEPTSEPRVQPAAGPPHTSAENRNAVLGLLRRDERKPHRLCFAKNAVAFFKISRSSSAIRSALRSRTSSSRSAVVRPVRPFE